MAAKKSVVTVLPLQPLYFTEIVAITSKSLLQVALDARHLALKQY